MPSSWQSVGAGTEALFDTPSIVIRCERPAEYSCAVSRRLGTCALHAPHQNLGIVEPDQHTFNRQALTFQSKRPRGAISGSSRDPGEASTRWLFALAAIFIGLSLLAAAPGCYWGGSSTPATDSANAAPDAANPIGISQTSHGLPCDVDQVLQTLCRSCHGAAPTGGAPMPLVTYADLTRSSLSDPSKTVADVSVARMQNSARPMPPGAGAAAQAAVIAAWVSASYPQGSCNAPDDAGSIGPSADTTPPPDASTGPTGLPCDIDQLLQTSCRGCHGAVPSAGAPMALVTYADLTGPSLSDPTQTVAQLSASRMHDPNRPMPPGGGQDQNAVLIDTWVAANYPQGSCNGPDDAGPIGPGPDASPPPDASTGPTGLPCDVDQMLQSRCQGCHSAPPVGGAPMALVSYADLTGPSLSDPTRTVAQLSAARIRDTVRPMPPGGGQTQDAVLLETWIAASYPQGSCNSPPDAATNPYGTPPTCTSNQMSYGGEDLGGSMHPGLPCIGCHASNGGGEAPVFRLAGTVYPTAHEYDECNSTGATGATVVVTDHNGMVLTLPLLGVGNFYSTTPLALPYTAKVVRNGVERAMGEPQTSGDCNSCHTLNGANNAPGRIMFP